MPDRRINPSRTGEIPVYEGETQVDRDPQRPTTLPELPHQDMGSTTGKMPVYHEPADDTALRDEDAPV